MSSDSVVNGGTSIPNMGMSMSGNSTTSGVIGGGMGGAMGGGILGTNGDGRPPPPPHSSLLHMAGK